VHAGLDGLNRVVLVMDRRSGTGQVVDLVHLDIQGEIDVMPKQLESAMVEQVRDPVPGGRVKIVHTQDFMPPRQQKITQMRSQEAGPTGHQHPLSQ
jgi:hypothetical protein